MVLKRNEIKDAIKKDYPSLPDYFINLTIDMWEKNPEWFKEDKKAADKAVRKGRKPKQAPEVKTEYIGAVEIIEPKNETPTIVDFN
jgi:hypothetical protein